MHCYGKGNCFILLFNLYLRHLQYSAYDSHQLARGLGSFDSIVMKCVPAF
jgi:hypothetical protein